MKEDQKYKQLLMVLTKYNNVYGFYSRLARLHIMHAHYTVSVDNDELALSRSGEGRFGGRSSVDLSPYGGMRMRPMFGEMTKYIVLFRS